MHNAVFSLLIALVTTCVTALASSSLPSQAAEEDQPVVVQPVDGDPQEDPSAADLPLKSE